MDWKRWFRHAFTTRRALRRKFPLATLAAIEAAISKSERDHSGEIRFALEAALEPHEIRAGKTPRARAMEVFAALGVWDTEANNGVLIFVLLADQSVEIVADRGYNAWVKPPEWAAICESMNRLFREERYEDGALDGIRRVGAIVTKYFPWQPGTRNDNELPNRPTVL
jgi:uncharacterized membrane protein